LQSTSLFFVFERQGGSNWPLLQNSIF